MMQIPESIKEKYPHFKDFLEMFFSKYDPTGRLLITTWTQECILETAFLLGQDAEKVYYVDENQEKLDELKSKYPQIPAENCRKVEKVGGPDFETLVFGEWNFPRPTPPN